MKNKEFEKYLTKVRSNISNLHNRFYVWRGLQNEEYNKVYSKNKYFWGSVLFSLDKIFLMDLAKLFEKRDEQQEKLFGKGISLYRLMEFIDDDDIKQIIEAKIQSHQKIINSVKGWRDKLLAHEDEEVFLDKDNFHKKYPLKHGEIEDLIELSKEILGDINSAVSDVSTGYSYSVFIEQSEMDIKSIMDKLSKDDVK